MSVFVENSFMCERNYIQANRGSGAEKNVFLIEDHGVSGESMFKRLAVSVFSERVTPFFF